MHGATRTSSISCLVVTHSFLEYYPDSEEDETMPEGMAGAEDIHIDIARLPRSQRGTMKGKAAGAPKGSVKGSRSYKGGKEYSYCMTLATAITVRAILPSPS